jgi:hypothetical protein
MIKTPNIQDIEVALKETSKIHRAALDGTLYTNIGRNADAKLYDFLCAIQELPIMVQNMGIVVGKA